MREGRPGGAGGRSVGRTSRCLTSLFFDVHLSPFPLLPVLLSMPLLSISYITHLFHFPNLIVSRPPRRCSPSLIIMSFLGRHLFLF